MMGALMLLSLVMAAAIPDAFVKLGLGPRTGLRARLRRSPAAALGLHGLGLRPGQGCGDANATTPSCSPGRRSPESSGSLGAFVTQKRGSAAGDLAGGGADRHRRANARLLAAGPRRDADERLVPGRRPPRRALPAAVDDRLRRDPPASGGVLRRARTSAPMSRSPSRSGSSPALRCGRSTSPITPSTRPSGSTRPRVTPPASAAPDTPTRTC